MSYPAEFRKKVLEDADRTSIRVASKANKVSHGCISRWRAQARMVVTKGSSSESFEKVGKEIKTICPTFPGMDDGDKVEIVVKGITIKVKLCNLKSVLNEIGE